MRLKFETKLFTDSSFLENDNKKSIIVDDVMNELKKGELKTLFINGTGVYKMINYCIAVLENRVKEKENKLTLDNNCKLVVIRYDVAIKIDKSKSFGTFSGILRNGLYVEVKCIYQNFNKRKPRNKKFSHSFRFVL